MIFWDNPFGPASHFKLNPSALHQYCGADAVASPLAQSLTKVRLYTTETTNPPAKYVQKMVIKVQW
jgi:hypothetical protein